MMEVGEQVKYYLTLARNDNINAKKNSKFFIYSGSAPSSQASSQALHFETNLTG